MLICEGKIGHIYVTGKNCSEGYGSKGRGVYVQGSQQTLLFTWLCRELHQLHIHRPTPRRTGFEAFQAKNRGLVVFGAPQPGFCLELEAPGCGSLAAGALQTAASMYACEQCGAPGSAGVESAE